MRFPRTERFIAQALLAVWLWPVALVFRVGAADWSPTERTDQPWKVVSLRDAGGLGNLNIFNLDFERNTNSSRWGTAWIATSDGLHEYDGYTWRRHGRAEGLPSDFVRCVLVTRSDEIWVGTDQGAGRYDGKTFRTFGSETNLAGPNVRRITEDADGALWFCSDSWPDAGAGGGLTSLRGGQWRAYREADGLPSGYVVNYFRDSAGRQFAATLNGLAEFKEGRWGRAFPVPPGQEINWGSGCLAETPKTGLIYSTGREMFRLGEGGWSRLPSDVPHQHGIVATAAGDLLAVGRPRPDQSVFLEWIDGRWMPVSAEFTTPRGYTEDIKVAPDGSVWVAGYDCLVRWSRHGSHWREFRDLPTPKLVDSRGGVWFARTRGMSLPPGPAVRLQDGRWDSLGAAFDELVNHQHDDSVWGWSSNRLSRWQGTNRTDFAPAQTGLASYVAARGDEQGSFWLLGRDAQGNAAAVRHVGGQWEAAPVPELAGLNLWPTAAHSRNGVWFAGDRGAGTEAVLLRVSPDGNQRLNAAAGQLGILRMEFREDRFGALWLYGDAGLFRWVPGKSTRWDRLTELPGPSVTSCVERGDELWFGYSGVQGGRSAIIALRRGVWSHFPVATRGNLSLAPDGTLFADGVGQIFRIANQPDAQPVVQQLRSAEASRSVVQDLQGNLWVAAGESVFRFRSNPLPLRLALTGVTQVKVAEPLRVTAVPMDRFRPPGIRLGAHFSYRVDHGPWSPLGPEEQFAVDVSRLSEGMHQLEAFCQDATGGRRSEPVVHRFQVVPVPLQERPWFVPVVLGVAGVTTMLALATLSARRRLADYARTLEDRVAARTAELERDIRRREAVEASLRASEARYRALFEYAPDGILIGDAQSTYLDANPSMCRMLGYTHDELVGLNATDIIAPAEAPQIAPTIAAIHRRTDHHHEWTFRRKDGSLVPVEVRATLTPDGNLLGLVRDLTERKRNEAALRAKDELLRLVIDLVPHFIFAKDRDSRFLFANRAVAESVGVAPEELVGRRAPQLPRDPSEEAAFLRDDREVIVSGKPKFMPAETLTDVHGRVRIYETTKIPFRVPDTGEPALLGVSIEITEQQRMKRLLEWELRALERLFANVSLAELLRELVLGVEQHSPGALYSILLLDEDGRHLRHGAAPSLPAEFTRAIDGSAIGPDAGSCGTAAATGRRIIVSDIAEDPLWADYRSLALAHGLRACWSVPVFDGAGKLLGTFAIYYREPRSPQPAELELITRAQHLAGLAIERKRAEESLQMTRLSVDRAGDSIFWLGRDGRIHYANEAACAGRGYARAELVGMTAFDLDPHLTPAMWEAHFDELKRLGGLTVESRHRTKDGRLFPVEINENYVFVRGQELNFCSVRDITERHRVERRRNLEHAVSRILAESASMAEATPRVLEAIGSTEEWTFGELWSVDTTDGRLVCQESWAAPGLSCESLVSQTRQLRLGPGDGLPGWAFADGDMVVVPELAAEPRFVRAREAAAAGLVSALALPLRGGGPVTGVLVFLGRRPIEVDSELRETLHNLGDQLGQFMARKLAQEEVRRFVALSPSVIYALRFTPTGLRAYWVSDNLFNLTGYHPNESIHGTWWADHLHPEDRDRVLKENSQLGELEQQVVEFRFRRKDGAYISLRDEKRLRRDAAGNPVEIIGAWTDITSRVNLEKQLRQAQKMEAVGQLSGGIAHDFNNLLGTIIGNAQLAEMDIPSEHPAAESLGQILTASRRASHLVQQILTFARQERTQRHRVNLASVAEESVRLLRATLPAGVELSLSLGQDLPPVLADETQIQQVLINLGTNSWHAFEGRNGRIAVGLSAVEVDPALAASCPDLKPGPYLCIRVEDTGKGMDAATLERIFEPFFTTKEVGKGTGLGLSVVHGIMKAHGGAVTVQSAVGVGTKFDLFLPAAPGDEASGAAPVSAELKIGRGEQLLLIDDQAEMLRTHQRSLERLGYRVVACVDAAEAMNRFRADPAAFALVLTDLNMPGRSGVELARLVLELRPGLPVLLTSGFIPEEVRQAALAAGVREIVRKPVMLPELSAVIARNLPPTSVGESDSKLRA